MILDYLLHTLVPGFFAIGVGGGLGLAFVFILRRTITSPLHLQRWALLFPWRTIMVAPLYYTSLPYLLYLLIFFNAGLDEWQASVVFITIFLLAFWFTVIFTLESRIPTSLRMRIFGLARTLAVGSMLVGVGEPFGLGRPDDIVGRIWRAENALRFQEASMLWLVIVGIILFVDIMLGILQFLLFDRSRQANSLP